MSKKHRAVRVGGSPVTLIRAEERRRIHSLLPSRKIASLLDNMTTSDENVRVANDQILKMTLSAFLLQERYRPAQ